MSDEKKDETVGHNEEDTKAKSSTGLEENVAGLLCYLATIITGIIFLVIEKENQTVRFHAMQSIVTFVTIFVASFVLGLIPFIGWIISLLLVPVSIILWILLMYKAYQGEKYKLPYIGDFSEKQVNQMNK